MATKKSHLAVLPSHESPKSARHRKVACTERNRGPDCRPSAAAL